MSKKRKSQAKSRFEKAAARFGNFRESNQSLTLIPNGTNRFFFQDQGDRIICRNNYAGDDELEVRGGTTVGDICKFIALWLDAVRVPGVKPPPKLKGTGKGGFEQLLMDEATYRENEGAFTMGRYPVASVNIPGSKMPLQIPSLPDFEGVQPTGKQFIIEAKVSSKPAFEIDKPSLKPKQIFHMLRRSKFNVECFLLIHFNERQLQTTYDPPFTVGIPVGYTYKGKATGMLETWEKYAHSKGDYAGNITREKAREIGILVPWRTPRRCRTLRPDIGELLDLPRAYNG